MTDRTIWQLLSLCLLISPTLGCGPATGSLSGRVTLDGQPITSGVVTCIGPDNVPMVSRIQPDGRYHVEGVGAGIVRIAVESPESSTVHTGPVGEPNAPQTQPATVSNWRPIPERYGNVKTSDISFSLKTTSNAFDVDLKSQ